MTVDSAEAERSARDSWQAQATRYALLFDIVLLIASSKNLDDLLTQSVNKIKWVFDFNRCTLALRDGDDDSYRLETLLDTRRGVENMTLESVPLSDGLSGEVIRTGQMRFYNDLQKSIGEISSIVDPAVASGELNSLLVVPLEAYGRVLGALSFGAVRSDCFSDDDVKVAVQFATHLGLAIDRWQATEERQRAEAELAVMLEEVQQAEADSSRVQLGEAIEAISEGFALFDADDRLVMCNGVYREYFERVAEMVTPGTRFVEFMRKALERKMFPLVEDVDDVDAWLKKVLERRAERKGTREQFIDGGIWLQISDYKTAEGGTVSTYTDVTELKNRQKKQQELIEQLQVAHAEAEGARTQLFEAIEAIADGFALFDADDRLVMSNKVYKEYFSGVEDKVEPGTAWQDFFRAGIERGVFEIDADSAEGELERTNTIRIEGRTILREFSDGRWLQITHHHTVDGGLVAIYSDITELKQREVQLGELVDNLAQARDQAMEATRTKSQFLANMSHELRTPLNAVIGIAEMLHEDAEDDGLEEFIEPLDRINNAGKHLLNLINEILDLSKIEAGKVEMLSENFEVKSMLDEVSTMVQQLAQKNSNTLTVDCADDIGQMRADPTRVRQIVFNLLSNACKFTENGSVTVTVRKDDGCLSFAVADTGIGITDDQMARLFQEFSQADASTTRKYGGTGLGLTISQRLCKLMGGDISVESEPDVGTTFTAILPINVPDIREDGEEIYEAIIPVSKGTAGRGNLVLVIDDDETVRNLMERHISQDGFKVVTAKDGIEGLKLARELDPAVITLDVLMPGADGWQVLRELKADSALADIPVVMCTILDDKNKGYALGAADYLNKPVGRENLRDVLGRYLSSAAGARVLVIEDDESTRTMLRRLLVGEGCLVSEAANGRLALERLEDGRPDLILLDLMMPEMDGFEFLAEIRTMEAHANIPVVVITAADLSEQDRARLNGGVEQILRKTAFDRDDLLDQVRREVARILGAPGDGDSS
jgi:signal transduction histidine kinase/DNA-binding response OmpR family regulator/putative methionine-R-sulfoxide reductase with GAF domain